MFFEALLFPSVGHGQLCILEWLGVGAASHDCSPGIFFLFDNWQCSETNAFRGCLVGFLIPDPVMDNRLFERHSQAGCSHLALLNK